MPKPPVNESLPAAPLIVSLPSPPIIVSLPVPPVIESAFDEPVKVVAAPVLITLKPFVLAVARLKLTAKAEVDRLTVPLLVVVTPAVQVAPTVALAIAEALTFNISLPPVPKSPMLSVPASTTKVSTPAPPVKLSLPAPPVNVSLPTLPLIVSLPAPPVIESAFLEPASVLPMPVLVTLKPLALSVARFKLRAKPCASILAVPVFVVFTFAFHAAPSVALMVADALTFNTSTPPKPRSVTLSVPASTIKVSIPTPPVKLSLPAPPVIESLPASPIIVSLPAAPIIVSLPVPPVIESAFDEPVKVVAVPVSVMLNPLVVAVARLKLTAKPFVDKFAVPMLVVFTFAFHAAPSVALTTAPAFTLMTSVPPIPKSVMLSVPAPTTKVSIPAPPVKTSLPAPPSKVLAPELPVIALSSEFPVPCRAAVPVSNKPSTLAVSE